MIETTVVSHRPVVPFSRAISLAETCITPDKDDTFSAAVDIKRARMHRIAPLGLKSETAVGDRTADSIVTEVGLDEAPALPKFDNEEHIEPEQETPKTRVERWQRRLLDLTLRNPLINHKAATTSLKLICPAPDQLEDKLAAGNRISIVALPQPSALGQDEAIHRRRTGEVIADEYAREALDKRQVLVDLPPADLTKRAVEIYRKAQTALQEGGSNTLYLALGFLLWKRDEKDDRRFRAPLILLPVALERKSVRSGIKMLAHDDEPRFNTTLLEMLRKDFGIDIRGLDNELPMDESGVDVQLVWNKVRAAVKEAPGFEVVEDVVLGHFSFAKYLMWKDLIDRTAALRENQVVRHLIDTPRDPYPCEIEFVKSEALDREFAPTDLMVPRAADASQMAAIATADRGKDFVIIGPPGTGKSQTISNMIAHLLGKGRSILFVSEKTAALEVVYRRLNEVGLGRFCLELHSNKAKKTAVLNQFRTSWESASRTSTDAWNQEGEKLRILRDKLNKLVSHLHKVHPNGLTPHYAIGVKVRNQELAGRLKFSWSRAGQHDAVALEKMRDAVERLALQAKALGTFSDTPLGIISSGDWSPQWEAQIVETAGRLASAARSAERTCEGLCEAVGISLPDKTFQRLDALAALAQILNDSYRKQTSFALEPDGQDRIDALESAVDHLRKYAENQAALSCSYEPMAWRKLDGAEIEKTWQSIQSSWWLKRIWLQYKMSKEMQAGGALGKPDPAKDAAILQQLKQHGEALDRLDRQLSEFRGWNGHTTDPQVAIELQNSGQQIRVAVSKLADSAEALIEVRSKVRTLLREENDLLAPDTALRRSIGAFLESFNVFRDTSSAFESIAGQSIRQYFAECDGTLDMVRATAETVADRHNELRDWCAWRKRRKEAVELDLLPLIEAIEVDRVPFAEIAETFEAAYCNWWSGAVIGEDEVLRTFSTVEHNTDILKFCEIDSRFQKITADYVAAKLSGTLPDMDDVKKSSQWGVLRHELQKKTRHKPIRQLMREIPEVVTTLAPCLMMSPLSVAQYLPADQSLFDVVIFDEASQITVWDAVGAIARGKQVIVTGDPKQMPPTNFFARSDDDSDADMETDVDLESILDEMLGASIPRKMLNLHYRSRKESLIAFSNAKYYDNSLVTFPAPVFPDRGVSLIRPNGFYARGGARHNEGEARAIVDEIVRRLNHPDASIRKLSLGVVSFNSEQQSLIEDLLDDARAKDPGIEWAFSNELLEPVFVKNLETVQGDERDVILFSVTYGPDQSGHVTMNFGPLNRTGGERRLNVAMTRARTEMLVFSTLRADQIELSRTGSRAVADLRHFLEYAERGPSSIGSFVAGSIGDFESPFESAVASALKEKGWEVHPQVGVSAYRVDLGIVDPDAPGSYLTGIECDGAMYHSSQFARERDKIRQAVLSDLGWTLLRVWSTDWWSNRAKSVEVLHNTLLAQLEKHRQQKPCDVDVEQESSV